MNKEKMSRKGFLKLAFGAVALTVLSKIGKFENWGNLSSIGKGEERYGKSPYGGKSQS